MPTYQYECDACGHGFETFQSMTDKKLKKCPKCGKNRLQRLIGSGSGVIFKGTGFYETDFKTKKPSKTEKNAPKTESKTTSGHTDNLPAGRVGSLGNRQACCGRVGSLGKGHCGSAPPSSKT